MFSTETYIAEKTQIKVTREPQKRVARIELDNGINISVTENNLPMVMGREMDCDLRIPDAHVSRRHCELYMTNGTLCVRDMSSNGTQVGNRVLKKESMTIKGRTTIILAGDARIVIEPCDELAPAKNRRKRSADRRASSDRRQGEERRQEFIIVPFEQRTDVGRRNSEERRCIERR